MKPITQLVECTLDRCGVSSSNLLRLTWILETSVRLIHSDKYQELNMTVSTLTLLLFFSVSSYCFWIGLFGLCTANNRNFILVLLSIELVLLGVSGFFLVYTFYHVLVVGQIYVLVLITLAGAESALGLALMMLLFRLTQRINLDSITNLKT